MNEQPYTLKDVYGHKDYAKKLYRRSDDPHYFAPFSNVTCALVAAVGILAILWLA